MAGLLYTTAAGLPGQGSYETGKPPRCGASSPWTLQGITSAALCSARRPPGLTSQEKRKDMGNGRFWGRRVQGQKPAMGEACVLGPGTLVPYKGVFMAGQHTSQLVCQSGCPGVLVGVLQ